MGSQLPDIPPAWNAFFYICMAIFIVTFFVFVTFIANCIYIQVNNNVIKFLSVMHRHTNRHMLTEALTNTMTDRHRNTIQTDFFSFAFILDIKHITWAHLQTQQ